jgi:D-alanyl-D-alanine carboxypeptidase/D-alanyl-D-alanine-endopeptidase (penicillin-binding protein 4)
MVTRPLAGWIPAIVAGLTSLVAPRPSTHAQDLSELHGTLASAIGTGWRGATWGVAVVSLDTGDTLFAIEPDLPLAPASNVKLLTSAAALEVLGPDYRFRTYLMTDGEIEDGVLHGDLILYGTGDPGISDRFFRRKDEVFHRLIDELERLGIHTVTGDLVGDASYLAGPLRPEGWDPRDLNDHFAAAVSALSFNENVVSFRVVAGAPGERPRVLTVPDYADLEIVNNATTVEHGAGRVHIFRNHPLEPVRVEGQIVAGSRDVWREMTVSLPSHFAVSVFRATLERRGIVVEGGLRLVDTSQASTLGALHAPALGKRGARVLARHVSRPLSEYLDVVNKQSNNLFAELVFRTLGRVVEGVGTPEAGARAVRRALTQLGVDTRSVAQADGSGLSAANRVSPMTFVSLVDRMSRSSRWDSFWASLPEAGRRGGLGRMYNTAAAGNLRAKTGTIEGVSALSGLVHTQDGERVAFSIVVNGATSTSRAKRVENDVGAALAAFRRPAGTPPPVVLASAAAELQAALVDRASRHRVTSGESLPVIAERYGLTIEELVGANPMLDTDGIVAGEWLDIPQRVGS